MAHQGSRNAPRAALPQRGSGPDVSGSAAPNKRPGFEGDEPSSKDEEPFTTVSRRPSTKRGPNNRGPNNPGPNNPGPNSLGPNNSGPGRQGGPNWPRNNMPSIRGGRPSAFIPPPSAAAASRAGQYSVQTMSGFDYVKQSALPVGKRDPVLSEVEQNKGRKMRRDSYRPGMIFRAILHEQYNDGVSVIDERAKTESIFGRIHSKYRKMIVVALYEDHCVAIPVYTHNGSGLAAKLKPDEYVSVRDHRAKGEFTALSVHQPLITEILNEGVEPYETKSVAHLTFPVSKNYDLAIVPEGHLAKASTKRMLQLYIQFCPRLSSLPR